MTAIVRQVTAGLKDGGRDPGHPVRPAAPHRGSPTGGCEEVEEFALSQRPLVGDVVGLADRTGVVGRQDRCVGDDSGIHGADRVVTPPDQAAVAPRSRSTKRG